MRGDHSLLDDDVMRPCAIGFSMPVNAGAVQDMMPGVMMICRMVHRHVGRMDVARRGVHVSCDLPKSWGCSKCKHGERCSKFHGFLLLLASRQILTTR
jgi:hypothetical protein